MAQQLADIPDGAGPTSWVTPADTTKLVLSAWRPSADEAPDRVYLEYTPDGGQTVIYVPGSDIDLQRQKSGMTAIGSLPDGAEIRAQVRPVVGSEASNTKAKVWLEGSAYPA